MAYASDYKGLWFVAAVPIIRAQLGYSQEGEWVSRDTHRGQMNVGYLTYTPTRIFNVRQEAATQLNHRGWRPFAVP